MALSRRCTPRHPLPLSKLLVFNPHKRLTAEQALRHPYVAQFHNLADEPSCNRIIVLPISDNTKYTVSEYRCARGRGWIGEMPRLP